MSMDRDWKKFFTQSDMNCIFLMMRDANIALNTAANMKGQIIHPGAICVFCTILENILSEMKNFAKECERADLDAFTKKEWIKKEEAE